MTLKEIVEAFDGKKKGTSLISPYFCISITNIY
jgi:hypothetical protein